MSTPGSSDDHVPMGDAAEAIRSAAAGVRRFTLTFSDGRCIEGWQWSDGEVSLHQKVSLHQSLDSLTSALLAYPGAEFRWRDEAVNPL
ncbi:hypothetical protein BA059_01125 [Mycolicibacterium sp. (ex Dasyatis americana)]|uniref:hypothetical protein n=1 Tax=Mycolicibacterium fortuitum TaxID=1766 RepID=UPI0006CAF17D|nr:hypothetical protein [Mycolicibacterium fortuitum]OFB45784.1 hypothetical protein BA059_01125 [Mycolicibacterium sp. (ex Dasyatis americana)]